MTFLTIGTTAMMPRYTAKIDQIRYGITVDLSALYKTGNKKSFVFAGPTVDLFVGCLLRAKR